MAWPVPSSVIVDDKDFDDAALWAAIDSAAAATLSSSETRKPLALKRPNLHSPIPNLHPSPPPSKPFQYDSRVSSDHRPLKIARYCSSEISPPPPTMAVVKHVQRTPPTTPAYSPPVAYSVSSPGNGVPFSSGKEQSSVLNSEGLNWRQSNEKEDVMRHSLSGRFPTVSLFKEYQNAAMAILEKSDYMMISGSPYIKKSGWRKISFYFNVSYEIKDKTIEFDENRNVQRAEFVVRAYMQGGRFSDGWGSCERREKRFLKPNHDIPSTAETRAKNKACQDLLGIGEYRSGASHVQR